MRWNSPAGGVGGYEISMSEGQVRTVANFGQTYREVGQSTNLTEPVFVYYEDDGALDGEFFGYPGGSNKPLVLGTELTVDRYGYAPNDVHCGARIKYGITYQLREYLYLE
jgi:hypothetical protein